MATSLITQGLQFPDNTVMYSASELERTIVITSATTTIDLSASNYSSFIKANVTASSVITFTNPLNTTDTVYSFSLMTTNLGSAHNLSFGNSVKWPDGVQPARTTANNGVDVWSFFVSSNTYYGSLSMANVS